MQTITIKMDDIVADKNQPRKIFDENQIESLAKSIKKYGLLQPILVQGKDGKYQIIAGERRYRACKKLGLKYVDVIVKNSDNVMQIALIENIQRENLSPLEEAQAIKKLKDENNYTHEELAKMLGKTRVYVTNKLRILGVDELTKKMLEKNEITEGHARALLTEKDVEKRQKLAKRILNENLSVREVEKGVKKHKKQSDYDDVIEILEEKLSTKVFIDDINNQKSIVIQFYSDEQLQYIIDKIY